MRADREAFEKRAEEARKSAVDAMSRGPQPPPVPAIPPPGRVMTGRERCGTAPNGAPDCVVAAQQLCRKHGFASGTSMDFTSARECPARAWAAGRPDDAECLTVTFISRAMCQ
jgi:hypothetical protein